MGLNLTQVLLDVIAPVEAAMPARVAKCPTLLLGTMLVESGGVYLKQLDGGPAWGLLEMETATHNDCYTNFLRYPNNADIMAAVSSTIGSGAFAGPQAMAGNLFYAFAMARVKYFRAPGKLPDMLDAQALADYHKTYYNTADGATVEDQSVKLFEQAIAAFQNPEHDAE